MYAIVSSSSEMVLLSSGYKWRVVLIKLVLPVEIVVFFSWVAVVCPASAVSCMFVVVGSVLGIWSGENIVFRSFVQ